MSPSQLTVALRRNAIRFHRCSLARAIVLAAITATKPATLWGHGDDREQIDSLTQQISGSPRNAALYLKRGELHRLHREWAAAQADFDQAEQFDPKLPLIDLLRGKLLLEMNQAPAAKMCLDRFLTTRPRHVEALVTRAHAFAKLNDAGAAAKDFSAAIAHSPEPRPEFFLERAQALCSDKKNLAEALRGLDDGIHQLGPLVTLETLAIELELSAGNHDGALTRVDLLAGQASRKEFWLARRGEILLEARRRPEAQAAFTQALAEIETLPESLRTTDSIAKLTARLRALLQASANTPTRDLFVSPVEQMKANSVGAE